MLEDSEIIFITTIGTNPNYDLVKWRLDDGKGFDCKFACVALENLKQYKGHCIILATKGVLDKSSKYIEEIKKSFKTINSNSVHVLEISDGRNANECFEIAEKLINKIETIAGSSYPSIVLDLTMSLRHLPFIYFCALTYLTGLRGFKIDGIYYGAFELKDKDTNTSPIVNMTQMFKLIELYQSFIQVNKTGHFNNLAHIAKTDITQFIRFGNNNNVHPNLITALKGPLERLSVAFPAGLVRDIGKNSARLANAMDNFKANYEKENSPSSLNLLFKSFFQFEELINKWSTSNEKSDLNKSELEWQLDLINSYIEFGYYQNAAILLREWYINFLIFNYNCDLDKWLEKDIRSRYEAKLYKFFKTNSHNNIDLLWGKVTEIRNKFAHAFMKIENEIKLITIKDKLIEIYENCQILLDSAQPNILKINDSNSKVLITPLGRSLGVLYSALSHFKPDHTIIITSDEVVHELDGIINKVNLLENNKYSSQNFTTIILNDPYIGFDEFKPILDKINNLPFLDSVYELIFNFTGGTTAMQFIVQSLAQKLSTRADIVTCKALIDKRSNVEQQNNPFVLSQVFDLDFKN